MKKLFIATLLACLSVSLLIGCGTKEEAAPEAAPETETSDMEDEEEEEDEDMDEEENYETGDASLDDPRNQDDIGEKEILVVSFGTSYNDSRRLTIGAIEDAIAESFPDYDVRRAFTSQIIIDHIKKRDGVDIDNVEQALKRAADNGVKELLVQPTHLMNGLEYNDLVAQIADYSDAFDKVAIGEPLLTSDEDFSKVASAIISATEEYDDGKTAIVFMGHGTEADSNKVYAQMQELLGSMGENNYYIGTVEADPDIEDVVDMIRDKGYERVLLRPLMVVAGDHANNDMAGDEDDSWKSILEAEGYEVETVLSGMGEIKEIRDIYVDHVKEIEK